MSFEKKDEKNFPLSVKMANINPSINSKFDGLCSLRKLIKINHQTIDNLYVQIYSSGI